MTSGASTTPACRRWPGSPPAATSSSPRSTGPSPPPRSASTSSASPTSTAPAPTSRAAGHVDLLTNGWIGELGQPFGEQTKNFRVGTIQSAFSDVFLTGPEKIIDAQSDAAADVTGVNIWLAAGTGLTTGGIGTTDNYLETNVDDRPARPARPAQAR